MPDAERLAPLEDWGARLDAGRRQARQPAGDEPTQRSSSRSRTRSRVCHLPVAALSRSAQRVPPGRRAQALRDVGRRARLLPALGQPGRPPGAARRRLRLTPALDAASDAVCTALQLANFWQDLESRLAQGPPLRAAARPARRRARTKPIWTARRMTPEWQRGAGATRRSARARCSPRAAPVCDGVRGRLRWELRATWLGGTRILDRLEAARFDVFADRPTLSERRCAGDRVASCDVADELPVDHL